MAHWASIYGVEADFSWLSNNTNYVDPNGLINNFYPSETNRLNELGTVRGRLRLAVEYTILFYGRIVLCQRE